MGKHKCENCGIILQWNEVTRIADISGKVHRLCIDCANDKYLQNISDKRGEEGQPPRSQ